MGKQSKAVDANDPDRLWRTEHMLPAEMIDIKIGAIVYMINGKDIQADIVRRHIIRDRVMAPRNNYGRPIGEDETLQQFADYNEYVKNRVKKRCCLIIKK